MRTTGCSSWKTWVESSNHQSRWSESWPRFVAWLKGVGFVILLTFSFVFVRSFVSLFDSTYLPTKKISMRKKIYGENPMFVLDASMHLLTRRWPSVWIDDTGIRYYMKVLTYWDNLILKPPWLYLLDFRCSHFHEVALPVGPFWERDNHWGTGFEDLHKWIELFNGSYCW